MERVTYKIKRIAINLCYDIVNNGYSVREVEQLQKN